MLAVYANIPFPLRSSSSFSFRILIHLETYTSFHFHLLHAPQQLHGLSSSLISTPLCYVHSVTTQALFQR